jgi:anti-anti-sigma factor
MQQSTPAEYKPCSKSSPQMGSKVDRLSGSCDASTFGQPPRSQHSFSVRLEDSPRLAFNGELPHIVRTRLRRGERRIVLDLAGVSRIDAAGIGELVRAYNIALASSGAVRIVNTSPRVREMLERVGLFDRLNAGPNDTWDPHRAEDRDVAGAYDAGSVSLKFRRPPNC